MVNPYLLLRQMLQLTPDPWELAAQPFRHQTLRETVAVLDDQLVQSHDGKTYERIEAMRHAVAASQGAKVQTAV